MNSKDHQPQSRRQFFWELGAGFAGLALSSMLAKDNFVPSSFANQRVAPPLFPKPPQIPTKAK
ncbi:MAG: DUF1501 domain-containing protein, partial [Verrucomicrobiales bacterium]